MAKQSILNDDLTLLVGKLVGYNFVIKNNILEVTYICKLCKVAKNFKGIREITKKNKVYCKKCCPIKYHRPAEFTLSGNMFLEMKNYQGKLYTYKQLAEISKCKYPNGKSLKFAVSQLLYYCHIVKIGDKYKYNIGNTKYKYWNH